jgi:endonuclease-8
MPEVTEVRKYADFLKKKMKNNDILEINIFNGRYHKHKPFELYSEMIKKLPIKVLDIKTKGKFMYFCFDNDYYLFCTLGLQGGWCYLDTKTDKYYFPNLIDYVAEEKREIYRKNALNHLNVEFKIVDGSIFFYDTLSFGTLKGIKDENELMKKLKSIGPDIMDLSTTFDVFQDRILLKKNLKKAIGVVLLDQKVISGIGNYLRSDILWICHISPFRKVSDLKEDELKKIYYEARLLTWGDYDREKAIKEGIITKMDKIPTDYKRDFYVYMADKDIYGNQVIKEELYEGSQKRFIYWVSSIQK